MRSFFFAFFVKKEKGKWRVLFVRFFSFFYIIFFVFRHRQGGGPAISHAGFASGNPSLGDSEGGNRNLGPKLNVATASKVPNETFFFFVFVVAVVSFFFSFYFSLSASFAAVALSAAAAAATPPPPPPPPLGGGGVKRDPAG